MFEVEETKGQRFLNAAASAIGMSIIGAVFGLIMSIILLAFGLLRIIFALIDGTRITFDDVGFIAGYILAFILGGAASGLLWPLRRWIGGYYGLGIIGMSFVVGIISVHESGPMPSWDLWDWLIAVLMSVAFGLVVGHGLKTASLDITNGLTSG